MARDRDKAAPVVVDATWPLTSALDRLQPPRGGYDFVGTLMQFELSNPHMIRT